MARLYLPRRDGEEGQEIERLYPDASFEQLDEWAQRYGYKNRETFTAAIWKRWGIHRTKINDWRPSAEKPEEKPEPEVKIVTPQVREYTPKAVGKGDPETQVIIIGDDHAGLKTPSFDSKVYKKRFDVLFQSAMTITELHRNMYPLNDLVILDVGDNVQGENPYQGSTIGAVECGAVEQVYDLALPTITSLLYSFSQQFKTVQFYGVRGNHGRYSRTAPQTSNWDLALYRALSHVKFPSGVKVYYSDAFNELVTIEGFKFFVFHGDQSRGAQYGIPYFALIRALKDWYVTYKGFPYAVCGHWHKEDFLRVTSETKLLINGALTTDDPFTLETIKTSTIPNHWTLGVHKKRGLTWLYSLIADTAFLPQKGA